MKPAEIKQEYIRLRAEGRSYSYIADKLHIAKSTCTAWEKELEAEVAQLKREELKSLYDAYGMTKEARIKKLGDTLERVEDALGAVDLKTIPPEKLLDFKLKYTEALQREYTGTEPAFKAGDKIDARQILTAFGDLLNRLRAGDTTPEQATRESLVLSNLLKAYDTVEVKAELEQLKSIIESR